MNATCAKTALIPLVLAATWATAKADDFLVSVTPNAGISLNDVHVYSAVTTTTGANFSGDPVNSNPGTTTQGEQALTSLGSVSGGSTASTVVSTSYGTSTLFSDNGSEAMFGLLATSGDLAVLSASASTTTYGGQFGSSNKTLDQVVAGTRSGDLGLASALFPADNSNGLSSYDTPGSFVTGTLFRFDSTGAATSIGTWSVAPQAVPEPASMAALGLGALGLMRRRRKLA